MTAWKFYGGAVIGALELVAISAVIYAIIFLICARNTKERERASIVGICGAGSMLVLIKLGKPFFY